MSENSLPASYFDAIYAADPDPWRFATSPYERDKYAKTLDVLPRSRYLSAFEVGCSIGVLTHRLGDRCDKLLSVDASEAPLQIARRRCQTQPSIQFTKMMVPQEWPPGEFDLVLLSEVLYYLCEEDVSALARRVETFLMSGGDIALAHWTGATDYPLSGDNASELFLREVANFTGIVAQHRAEQFRLDVVTRR